MRKFSGMVFIILLILCIAQAAYYYPLLPDNVASHFGASGRPDAWASKEFFVKIYLIAVAFVAVLFPGVGFVSIKDPQRFDQSAEQGLLAVAGAKTRDCRLPGAAIHMVRFRNAYAVTGHHASVLQGASRP